MRKWLIETKLVWDRNDTYGTGEGSLTVKDVYRASSESFAKIDAATHSNRVLIKALGEFGPNYPRSWTREQNVTELL